MTESSIKWQCHLLIHAIISELDFCKIFWHFNFPLFGYIHQQGCCFITPSCKFHLVVTVLLDMLPHSIYIFYLRVFHWFAYGYYCYCGCNNNDTFISIGDPQIYFSWRVNVSPAARIPLCLVYFKFFVDFPSDHICLKKQFAQLDNAHFLVVLSTIVPMFIFLFVLSTSTIVSASASASALEQYTSR